MVRYADVCCGVLTVLCCGVLLFVTGTVLSGLYIYFTDDANLCICQVAVIVSSE